MTNKEIIKIFEKEYPELSKEFKDIQDEMYKMFAAKHMDYGLQNISLGGDLTKDNDKKFSLTGLAIRLTDKIVKTKKPFTKLMVEILLRVKEWKIHL